MDSRPSKPPVTRIGDYVLIRRLAVGGMAEIFVARRGDDKSDDSSTFVLKLLLPQLARDAEFIRMLEHEAHLNAQLTHPNLISVLEYHSGATPYLVMEYVDGLALYDLLISCRDGDRILPPSIAAFVTRELLSALAYVHDAKDDEGSPLQIVHRDVTPQNVLISRQGHIKLGDFGIARSSLRDTKTRTGVIKGKLRYLAPEQVTGSATDERTDLYAVGLILWELLAGSPYIEGDGEIELLRAAEAPQYRPPSAVADGDTKLDSVLRRALRLFPEERFPSARAFLTALEQSVNVDVEVCTKSIIALVEESMGDTETEAEPGLLVLSSEPTSGPTVNARPNRRASESRRESQDVPVQSSKRSAKTVMAALLAVVVVGLGLVLWQGSDEPHLPQRALESRLDTKADETRTHDPEAKADAAAPPPQIESSRPLPEQSVDSGHEARSVPSKGIPRSSDERGAASISSRRSVDAAIPTEEPDAAAAADSAQSTESVERQDRLLRQLSGMRSELRQRGILLDDLDSAHRSQLAEIERFLEQGRLDEAEVALARVGAQIRAIQIDSSFVRRKLERVDASVRRARSVGVSTPEIEALVGLALEDFVGGRFEPANRRLNRLHSLLVAARRDGERSSSESP